MARRALLAGLMLTTSAMGAEIGTGVVLVPAGSAWKYWVSTTPVAAPWLSPFFSDLDWPEDAAPLGYGETNLATTIGFGPDADNKIITTFFRRTFLVANPADFNRLFLRVRHDDGVAVYLNGAELFRHNLPAGDLSPNWFALTNVSGPAETLYYATNLAFPLALGSNLLAAEVHQAAPDSIDLSFDLELCASNLLHLVRGPYLQIGTSNSILVRWRTDNPVPGWVRFGRQVANLDDTRVEAAPTTEHEVVLTGLQADTRYYYSVGSLNQSLAGGPDYYFTTAPLAAKPTRVWVIGDTRPADGNVRAVRNAYARFAGARATDVWLTVGDNAGLTGTDEDHQAAVFDMFADLLRQTVLWPCVGNHDYYSAVAPNDFPYLRIFSLPTQGEAGGVPSGWETYYSFNYGNLHFVVLDSVTLDLSTNGAMWNWLQRDLATNHQDWLIALWHNPPYTRGSHDSDGDAEGRAMRENFLPLLEANGVDVVIGGHSHSYERSFLLDGHYSYSWTLTPAMVRNPGDGRPDGLGAYFKPAVGPQPHAGAVYVVAGGGGMMGGGTFNHPAMFFGENALGSLVLDIDGNTLEAKLLRETGAIDDAFTIIKGPPASETVRISSLRLVHGHVALQWNTVPGRLYQVHRCDGLGLPWSPVTQDLAGDGTPLVWSEALPPTPTNAFYRLVRRTN